MLETSIASKIKQTSHYSVHEVLRQQTFSKPIKLKWFVSEKLKGQELQRFCHGIVTRTKFYETLSDSPINDSTMLLFTRHINKQDKRYDTKFQNCQIISC